MWKPYEDCNKILLLGAAEYSEKFSNHETPLPFFIPKSPLGKN